MQKPAANGIRAAHGTRRSVAIAEHPEPHARRIASDVIVTLNVAAVPDDERLVDAVGGTLAADFPQVLQWPALRFNTIVLGLTEPLTAEEMRRRLGSGPRDLASLRQLLARDARPVEAADRPWTDDRAPVEWLTDRMIVAYAAEGGRLEEDYLPTRPSP